MSVDPIIWTLQRDLLLNILKYSEDIGRCALHITTQMREIIGARAVVLFEKGPDVGYSLVAVCPDRRRHEFESDDVKRLVEKAGTLESPAFVEPGKGEIGQRLSDLGMQASFIVPLCAWETQGVLLLLDVMDCKGVEQILQGLREISGILSLLLRNSFLYRHLEKLVEKKTTDLLKSEARYKEILQTAMDGFWRADMKGRIVEVNEAYCRMSGYREQEILSMSISDLDEIESLEDTRGHIERVVSSGQDRFESSHRRKDGTLFAVEVSVQYKPENKGSMVAFIRDITVRKKLLETAQKNQRLESLGILAGGIAHDFNNLLGGIYGYIDVARKESHEENVSSCLESAMKTIGRARGLTQQLLTFAKGGSPVREVQRLVPFIQETALFAASGSKASCHFHLEENLWPCNIDKNQIGQVLDNLVINALQAMPEGGTIDIMAQNLSLKEREYGGMSAGKYVKISVRDEGTGIPNENLEFIFDPFYTTKENGQGLGLATCHSIVRRHGGCIEVESEPGKGSTFHVYLPACDESVSPVSKDGKVRHKGSGTIIVMDDDEIIRDIVGKMLTALGYTAVCKKDGREAVDFWMEEQQAGRIVSALILDITVRGGMGGIEAAAEIRKSGSNIPIFVSSGYASDPQMATPEKYGFTASLCKPFRMAELEEILEKFVSHSSPKVWSNSGD